MTTNKQWQLANDAAERYERILVTSILGPAASALVAWSALQNGDSVLDVGCGTGAAARFAAQEVGSAGRVVGVDVNTAMIEVAQSLPPIEGAAIEWLEKSAYELPLETVGFDVALCAQTLQFLGDRPLALEQMHRALRPGGRAAVSLWCDIGQSPYFDVLVKAVTRHIGADTAAGLGAAFGFSDSDAILELFEGAGFIDIHTEVGQLELELPALKDFVPRHVSATPMAAGFSGAAEEVQKAVVEEVSELLDSYETDEGVRVPFRTHLIMGTK